MGRIIISRGLQAASPARGFFSTPILRTQPVLLPQSSQFRCTMSTSATQQPIYAQAEEENKLNPELSKLFESGWELDENKMGLKKTYHFKTYTKVLDFVQMVGIASKSKNHHSLMQLGHGHVSVHWTTHNPRGLTAKDIDMAQYCDNQGGLIKTVDRGEAAKCGPKP
ncbi:hypothetical protein DTO271D3_4105 [Paecilomyces variotii]|nr:hypothetical protein DTO169E5_440 [Paecilomyces variotii]KAJ9315532.1 hypothetical protein DTO271D3_4105 [Paecilomyces variotii]